MATVLFDGAQMRGWKVVVDAVHARGGKIVVQLMQTGRVAHVANLPPGAEVIAPTADMCPGEWTRIRTACSRTARRVR